MPRGIKLTLLDGSWYPSIPVICGCPDLNCNEVCWNGTEYKSGHNAKTKEGRKILSDVNLGKPSPMKGKPCLLLKGNKNAIKKPEETEKRNCGHHEAWNKGKSSWSKDKQFSESHKEKIRISLKGSKNPNFGKDPWNKGLDWKEMKGELNPMWIDGRSFLPYCFKFDNNFKEDVRNRDSHICQLCGKTQLENGEKLCVHHIHGDKPNCYPDCVALCRHCNLVKVEKKDKFKFYEELFMNNLNDRGLLFWSRRREKEQ